MQEMKVCQENKLGGCTLIRHLLQSSRDISEQTVQQLATALEETLTCRPEVYVGQVYDSCVYRIGCGDINTETKLCFSTPDVRNKFASSFEVACREVGLTVHRSY